MQLELDMVQKELRNRKCGFKPQWPVDPAIAVTVTDLPTQTPVPLSLSKMLCLTNKKSVAQLFESGSHS
jgi:hypothetical protein